MIEKKMSQILNLPNNIYDKFNMKDILFFDIETTGFDKEKANTILISMGYFLEKNVFYIKQYFAENLQEEKELLVEFKNNAINFEKWCTYNGIAFDEPFLRKRMSINNMGFNHNKNHLDLYRMIRPYYKELGMERCNLKTVEKYIGIEREDQIDGGMSIDLYYDFLINKDKNLREIIMLHNYEDVLNLPKIFKVIYEIQNNNKLKREDGITNKQIKYLSYLIKKNKISLDVNMKKISKKAASRIINDIIKGNIDENQFYKIIKNSY